MTTQLVTSVLNHYAYAASGLHKTPLGKFGVPHLLVCALCILLAVVRHSLVGTASAYAVVFAMTLILLTLSRFGLRVAVLYAMLSSVVDVVWLTLYPVADVKVLCVLWETVVGLLILKNNFDKND